MLFLLSIGPSGQKDYLIPRAKQVLEEAQIIVGYKAYVEAIQTHIVPETQIFTYPLGEEKKRAEHALQLAQQHEKVVLISSGDINIYGMAAITYEMLAKEQINLKIEVIPGVSAFQTLAARIGAPIGQDFCCISLSDHLIPWQSIEKRIQAAAMANFVTFLYNPRSSQRKWQLEFTRQSFLKYRNPQSPVAVGKSLGHSREEVYLSTLKDLSPQDIDMFSILLIGNEDSFVHQNLMITPRGYPTPKENDIQSRSFQHILSLWPQTQRTKYSKEFLWAALRCIHTTGDPTLWKDLFLTTHALSQWHEYLIQGGTLVTDVQTVATGLETYRKQYGNSIICHLNKTKLPNLGEQSTRTQRGIHDAALQHPKALFVIGNAPTALSEVLKLYEEKLIAPQGIIATPVGFINVLEAKARMKKVKSLPYALIQGHKGGSPLATALVNSAFSLPEASRFL
ncbi:MAG: precorrin-3B C(17)-methyltransferase [Cytophagales bacterium]|nr:precorrin-3B C(17)-methyltransferase [Cytophagales bacterium]